MGVTDGSGNLVVKYGYDRYGSVTSTAGTRLMQPVEQVRLPPPSGRRCTWVSSWCCSRHDHEPALTVQGRATNDVEPAGKVSSLEATMVVPSREREPSPLEAGLDRRCAASARRRGCGG